MIIDTTPNWDAWYANNPIYELTLKFKNFVEGLSDEMNEELNAEMLFFIDARSLDTVGMHTFCQWKLGMSEEQYNKTFEWKSTLWTDDNHFSAEYRINDEGNWFNVC